MNLETNRLIITKFTPDLAEAVHQNSLDEDTRRFLSDEVFETVEDAAALLDFAFKNLSINKVYAQCDCKNAASFGVMKKIGMTLIDDKGTRTYPKTGITSGEFTCLITREEWGNRK